MIPTEKYILFYISKCKLYKLNTWWSSLEWEKIGLSHAWKCSYYHLLYSIFRTVLFSVALNFLLKCRRHAHEYYIKFSTCAVRSHCLNINPSIVWNFTFQRALFLLPDLSLAEVLIVFSPAFDVVLTSPVSREAMSFLAYSPPLQHPDADWVHIVRENELKGTLVKVPQSVGLLWSNREPFHLLFHVIPILEIEISSLWIFFLSISQNEL